MKQKLFISVCIICFSLFANAQKGVHFGIKAGTNINKLSGQSFKDQFSFGYQLGGFASVGISKKFSIQPEVLFNQNNYDTTSKFSELYNVKNMSGVRLSYISIPVLLNYTPSRFFSLQAGPQFAILRDQNRNLLQNGADAFKKGDLSLLAGVQLNLSRKKVYGRYAVGLNNINDIDNKDKWRSQGFQLGVGLKLF